MEESEIVQALDDGGREYVSRSVDRGHVAVFWRAGWEKPIVLPSDVAYEISESDLCDLELPETVEITHDGRGITVYTYEVSR